MQNGIILSARLRKVLEEMEKITKEVEATQPIPGAQKLS